MVILKSKTSSMENKNVTPKSIKIKTDLCVQSTNYHQLPDTPSAFMEMDDEELTLATRSRQRTRYGSMTSQKFILSPDTTAVKGGHYHSISNTPGSSSKLKQTNVNSSNHKRNSNYDTNLDELDLNANRRRSSRMNERLNLQEESPSKRSANSPTTTSSRRRGRTPSSFTSTRKHPDGHPEEMEELESNAQYDSFIHQNNPMMQDLVEDDVDKENELMLIDGNGRQLFGFAKKVKKNRLMELVSKQTTPTKLNNNHSSRESSHPYSSKKMTPLRNVWLAHDDNDDENNKNDHEVAKNPSRKSSRVASRPPALSVKAPSSMPSVVIQQRSIRTSYTSDGNIESITLGKVQSKKRTRSETPTIPITPSRNRIYLPSTPTTSTRRSSRVLSAKFSHSPSAGIKPKSGRKKVKTSKETDLEKTDQEEEEQITRVTRSRANRGKIDPTALGTPTLRELRKKNVATKRLKTVQNEEDNASDSGSSSLDSFEEDDGFSSSDDNENETERAHKIQEKKDQYFFDAKDAKRIKTSDNNLSALPTMDMATIKSILSNVKCSYTQELEDLALKHGYMFDQWCYELSEGFNLMFYGFGSKIEMISEFIENSLAEMAPVVVVNGFFPSITLKHILRQITEQVMGMQVSITASNTAEVVQLIRKFFSDENGENQLYLVIHNIDGYNLRHEKIQSVLAELASITNINMIASVDHINSLLMWDNMIKYKFNWIWHDLTTFRPYELETSFENSFMVSNGDSQTMDVQGVLFVLRSLPGNTKKIFKEMALWQLEEMKRIDRKSAKYTTSSTSQNVCSNVKRTKSNSKRKDKDESSLPPCNRDIQQDSKSINDQNSGNSGMIGLTFKEFYQMCNAKFLASTQELFKTQLVEFKDHHLIHAVYSSDRGDQLLYIPLDKDSLDSVLETMD